MFGSSKGKLSTQGSCLVSDDHPDQNGLPYVYDPLQPLAVPRGEEIISRHVHESQETLGNINECMLINTAIQTAQPEIGFEVEGRSIFHHISVQSNTPSNQQTPSKTILSKRVSMGPDLDSETGLYSR